ncbi:MAG: DUF4922 domain-containing protein [Candidatus Amulumruptor caecigallinarius]|nr:DUF4922 domain-containing protein [Candidatus Amulumruptor caecigallinarius]MCM1396795.1 DUF4922 domain-containing protein [Candidatus Amulumruptor caecigallinarius]MCM1454510.1 DUF4922 domain-containing protein [bacterium]
MSTPPVSSTPMYPSCEELHAFFTHQLKSWPDAAARYAALAGVETRLLTVDGMPFTLQFNPARAVSSNAKTDAASIAARPCFLCSANRPAVQAAMPVGVGGRFGLLVNPFPIFREHFTVVDSTHRRQQLDGGALRTLLGLARNAPGYTWFYNGPRSGASAPDHLHLQGALDPSGTMSLTATALNGRRLLRRMGEATVAVCPGLPVRPFVVEGADVDAVARLVEAMIAAMPVREGEWEPRMNVYACATPHGSLEVVIVGREEHRPHQYFDGSLLTSPGAADMAGCFITTRREDFNALNETTLADILCQTRMADEPFYQTILNVISTSL